MPAICALTEVLPRSCENDRPERATTMIAFTHVFSPTGARCSDLNGLHKQKDITIEANHVGFTAVEEDLLDFEFYGGDEGAVH
jgi:hypothetical protein